MIRIVFGFFLVIGSAGGMELTSLSPMGALFFASVGLVYSYGLSLMERLTD